MDLAGKTILVTGGAGFIGSHLVDQLDDCRVRVLDDFSTGSRANLARHGADGRVSIVEGDVRDRKLLGRLLKDVDAVFHLACRGVRHSIGNPLENHEVNATGTLHLLGAARQAGVARLIHVSSSEVYGTARYAPMDENHPTFPETVYGAAKLAGECYSRAYHQTYGLPTVVVRPFNNFGPRSHHEGDCGEVIPRFTVWALNGQPPVIFGNGSQARDFIYVEDTAHWLRKVAECEELVGQTINLASGRETTVRQLASLVCEVVGRPDLMPVFAPARPGDVQRHIAGVEFARQSLGFRARTTLRQGIGQLVQFLQQKSGGAASLLADLPMINWSTSDIEPVAREPH